MASVITSIRVAFVISLSFVALAAGCGTGQEFPFTPVAGYATPDQEGCYVPDNEAELVEEVIRLVNEERAKHGLGPVTTNTTLASVAGGYACTMIAEEFFAHYHPDTGEGPGERATQAGYSYRAVGENLAAGQKTPSEVMRDWMNSTQGHRENILNPMWTHIGVAVRTGGPYGIYWVQEFGAPWANLFAQR